MTDPRPLARRTRGRTIEVAPGKHVAPDSTAQHRQGDARGAASGGTKAIAAARLHWACDFEVAVWTYNIRAKADERTGFESSEARDDAAAGPRSD